MAELVLTLILITILTQSLTLIYQPRNLFRHHCKFVFLSRERCCDKKILFYKCFKRKVFVHCYIFLETNEENVDSLRHKI